MSFTPIDGYAAVADLCVGSNSTGSSSYPELGLSDASQSQATGQFTWDSNTADGFDSGWVHFQLNVDAAGGSNSIQFSLGNSSPVTIAYSGASYDTIYGFLIRAGVSGSDRTFAFRNIVGDFYEENSSTPITSTVDDFAATTVGTSDPDNEVISVVAPDGIFKRASLFGDVRLTSADTPMLDDMFGQMFLYAA